MRALRAFFIRAEHVQLNDNVAVCSCGASHYKTTNVRAPHHVQEYWDAQCSAVYSSYRRRLKRYALPSVHAEHWGSNFIVGWRVISVGAESVEDESEYEESELEANLDHAVSTRSVFDLDTTAKLASVQRQTASMLHACRSALVSGLSRMADVRRENKGKAS